MADIKDQLIKDSYNYVLQSDLSTGIVYRIGGSIPVNPKFLSGLTINSGFTYSNGTEQNGYALLTDGTGYAYWGPVSGTSPSSGVTSITVGNGLSASSSTGAVTIVFTGSTGTSGDYLPLSGGTVTGPTTFQSGLTATTISATTYQNLPFSGTVTGNGTSNYLPKWTGSTSLGDSLIYDSGTNIGIGTSSPSAKLDIQLTGGTIGIRMSGDSSSDMLRVTQTGTGNAIVVEDNTNPDSTPFIVASDGKVLIGTTTPTTSVLTLIGNQSVTGNIYVTSSIQSGTAGRLYLAANANGNSYFNSGGNVGVGTTTPSEKLNVIGNVLINGSLTATTKTTIGSENDISCALLQMASTTQGVLFPRMTNTQRETISSPQPGLFVYCTDFPEGLFMYKSTGWVQIM
jgi:hypothetical protein